MRIPLILLCTAHLILLFPGQAFPDESDPVYLRKQMEKHIDAERWKDAERCAKKLKGKVTRREKKQVQQKLRRIQGELAWQRSEARIDRTKDLAKQLNITNAFLKKYRTVPELAGKATRKRDAIVKLLYVIITDFESRNDLPRGLVRVSKPALVRSGKHAARVEAGSAEKPVRVEVDEADWSSHRALVIWVHSREKKGAITIAAHNTPADYFQVEVPITWKGWKEIRVPLSTGSNEFTRVKKASWKNISDVHIGASNSVDIVIDHLRLERAAK